MCIRDRLTSSGAQQRQRQHCPSRSKRRRCITFDRQIRKPDGSGHPIGTLTVARRAVASRSMP
eukprot:1362490-Alexandrium_andersonii.AAC.1